MIGFLAALVLLTVGLEDPSRAETLEAKYEKLAEAFDSGDLDEAARIHTELRQADPAAMSEDEFMFLAAAADIAMELMSASEVRDYLTGLLEHAQALGYRREAVRLRISIADTHARNQNWAAIGAGFDDLRQAYEALESDEPLLSGRIFVLQGSAAIVSNQPELALGFLQAGISDLERAGERARHLVGLARATMGVAYYTQGSLIQAARVMDAAACDISETTHPGQDVRITSFTNAGMAAVYAGLHDPAQYWVRRAIEECNRSGSPADACQPARLYLALANVEHVRGDIRAALEASYAALRHLDEAAQGPESFTRIEAQMMAGSMASLANRHEDAADWMLAALQSPQWEGIGELRQSISASNTLTTLHRAGRFIEALELIERTSHLQEQMTRYLAVSAIKIAVGDLEASEAALAGAQALSDRGMIGNHQIANLLAARADLQLARNDLAGAIRLRRDALEMNANDFGRTDLQTLTRMYYLAELLILDARYEEARSLLAEAVAGLTTAHNFGMPPSVTDSLQPGLFFQRELASFALMEAIALSDAYPSQAEDLLSAAQLAIRRETGDAMRLAHALEGSTAEQRALLSRFETLQQERRDAHIAFSNALRDVDLEQSRQASEQIAEREAALWQMLDQLRDEIPRFSFVEAQSAVSTGDIQASLRPNEAFLLLMHTDRAAYVLAFTDTGVHWHRTRLDGTEICALVHRIRSSMDPGGAPPCHDMHATDEAPASGAFDRRAAHELYQVLIAPAEDLLAGRTQLIISANGALAALPVAALVTSAPRGNDRDDRALRNTTWLINRYAVSNLPDPASLVTLRNRDGSTPVTDGFIGVGAPCVLALDGRCEADGTVNIVTALRAVSAEQLRELEPLPGALDELELIAREVGGETVLLTGENATVDALLATGFRGRRVVAFATHGLTAGELGAHEPSLVMSVHANDPPGSGLLGASMIASRLQLESEWVVLSACNAIGQGVTAANGLARAFFVAGASRILATQIPVRDDVAVRLSLPVIVGDAAPPSERLQAAMMSLMNDRRLPGAAHPRLWAGYVVIGLD